MPLIEFVNWSTRPSELQENLRELSDPISTLAKSLRDAAVSADVPGLTKDTVTVTIGGRRVLSGDRTLIIKVSMLFDRPDRTKEVRDRLAQKLGEAAMKWVAPTWRVEVMIERFDPAVNSFFTTGPLEEA
ncbi:MAG: hypothetical protein ABIJ46_00860 [bacterium]